METLVGIASVICIATTAFGFGLFYQPQWLRGVGIRSYERSDRQETAERLRQKPLWPLRALGAALLVAAFLLAQLVLWVLDDMERQTYSFGSAILEGLMGSLFVVTGVMSVTMAKRQRQQLVEAGHRGILPVWAYRLLGIGMTIFGATLLWGVARFVVA